MSLLEVACLLGFPSCLSTLVEAQGPVPSLSAHLFTAHLSRLWERVCHLRCWNHLFLDRLQQKSRPHRIASHRTGSIPIHLCFFFCHYSSPYHEPKVFPEKDCFRGRKGKGFSLVLLHNIILEIPWPSWKRSIDP